MDTLNFADSAGEWQAAMSHQDGQLHEAAEADELAPWLSCRKCGQPVTTVPDVSPHLVTIMGWRSECFGRAA